ncbi:hypothetical protein F66182_5742 [Fusarium sp. NRRL 66182]|nr:hypothetical protein F66182_5742 [Fusarium sp. NRRL 66182]
MDPDPSKALAGLEHVDRKHDIRTHDDGDQNFWTPRTHGYLSIGDTAISKPSEDQARYIARPVANSVDVSVQLYAAPTDYCFLRYEFHAHDLGLENDYLCHILVYACHATPARALKVDDPQSAIAPYCKDAKVVADELMSLSIEAQHATLVLPPSTKQKLRSFSHGGAILVGHLKALQKAMNEAKENGAFVFNMLFAPGTEESVACLASLLNDRIEKDTVETPLLPYFEHSPQVRTLTFGQCPPPGSQGFPTNMHGVRISAFAHKDQHLLYNMCGSRYDSNLQWAGAELMEETTLTGYSLYVPHTHGRRVVTFVDAGGQDLILPTHGEPCKMRFPDSVPIPTPAGVVDGQSRLTDKEKDDIIHAIFQIIIKVGMYEDNFAESINSQAIGHLTRHFTEAEIDQLRKTEAEHDAEAVDEDDETHYHRVREVLRNIPDIFQGTHAAQGDGEPVKAESEV